MDNTGEPRFIPKREDGNSGTVTFEADGLAVVADVRYDKGQIATIVDPPITGGWYVAGWTIEGPQPIADDWSDLDDKVTSTVEEFMNSEDVK